jgi:hypothetical protein
MKLFVTVMLSALTIPAYAQGLLNSLENYQKEIVPQTSSPSSTDPSVKIDPIEKTKTSGVCEATEQTSLPLRYITSLILQKDGKLDIQHDPRTGKIKINTPDMISNCNSMIEWIPDVKVVEGRKKYSLEAKIKRGDNCETVDNKTLCSYKVTKVENKKFKEHATEKVEPNMNGFESCLQKAGVITKDNKVDENAIYPSELREEFSGYKETGDLLFVSRGMDSKMIKAKYDKFVEIDGCLHYEKITPEGIALKSLDDSERERILAERDEVMKCGDYERMADFRERHKEFAGDIDPIIEALLKDLAAKSIKAIQDNTSKNIDEDLKVINSFQRLVVDPKIEKATRLYEDTMTLEGDALRAAETELAKVKQTLVELNQAPYLSKALVDKMEADGRFDDAAKANHSKALLVNFSQLGNKKDGLTVTPDIASTNALAMKVAYENQLEIKKERFEISTGQRAGKSNYYVGLINKLRNDIQVRTHNYMEEINSEYMRMRPGGHCYKPFRNTQRCLADAQDRVNELQAYLTHYNKIDNERILEYEAKAKDYAALEKAGRDYVARQNGEVVPETPAPDTTMPPRNNTGTYTFDYNGGGNPQAAYQPQQYQQQQQQFQGGNQMGYQYYGQFGYGNQGQGQQQFGQYGYPQQNPYAQYQQGMQTQGYWNSPYQAYGNYNMYGGMNYGYR